MKRMKFSDLSGYLFFLILALGWFTIFLLMQIQGAVYITMVESMSIIELEIGIAWAAFISAIIWFIKRLVITGHISWGLGEHVEG
jgi:hypothetical protein